MNKQLDFTEGKNTGTAAADHAVLPVFAVSEAAQKALRKEENYGI